VAFLILANAEAQFVCLSELADDCVVVSLVAAAGGATGGFSLLAELAVDSLDSVFNGAGLGVAACVVASGGVERGAAATLDRRELVTAFLDEVVATLAGSAGAFDSVALLRVGAGAAVTGLPRVSVVAGAGATSAGAEVLGATLLDSVLLAVCTAGAGVLTALSLRL
jgi:hypothetical protein